MATLRPILVSREVSVFRNGYGELFNDEVTSPSGRPGQYLRWRWSVPGVICIPVLDGRVALATMYRYPIGSASLELPRGGLTDDAEPVEQAAERELREELGLRADRSTYLGEVFADTGLVQNSTSVVRTTVTTEAGSAALEDFESANRFTWYSEDRLDAAIREGALRCALSLAALSLARASGSLW